MGDTINVASRLEGMNKDYGTTILVSSVVAEARTEYFMFRPLGSAHAKGRTTELQVYELVENRSSAVDHTGPTSAHRVDKD